MPVPIHENSTIVFELLLIDVIAGLHPVHLIQPGTVLIILGAAVDRDKDHSFRRRITSSAISPYGVQPLIPTVADWRGVNDTWEAYKIIPIDLVSCFR